MDKINEIKKCLLVGFGNKLRGDDGLGLFIVENLNDSIIPKRIKISKLLIPQLDILLAEKLSEFDIVIFIDARSDDVNEYVKVEKIRLSAKKINSGYTSHILNIHTILKITQHLYGLKPECYLIMPKGFKFDISEKLSHKAKISAKKSEYYIIDILKKLK